jgi:transmembrane sensor
MDLSNYVVKDFVLNESFQKWILQPDDEIQYFWMNWLKDHPEKCDIIAEAKLFIQNINASMEESVPDFLDAWDKINDSLENFEVAEKTIDKADRSN